MSERWKPAIENVYWIVDFAFTKAVRPMRWDDDNIDNRTYNFGNCFKTEAEAKDAAQKVKALLLSLHSEPVTDCNQLPKLTADVFHRPDCPDEATFAIVYQNGSAAFMRGNCYDIRPSGKGWEYSRSSGVYQLCEIPGNWDASDWQNSLVERPAAKLPDWCKEGKWVYLCNGRYYKVESVNECHVNLSDGVSVGRNSIHSEMVSARLRPYNAEEMKALVGKVLTCNSRSNPCSFLVVYAEGDGSFIESYRFKYTAKELKDYFTIDGKPCGVLEHLENG